MSLPVASPASPTAKQENAEPVLMSVISGRNSGALFTSLGPDGSWLKTYQGYYQVMLDGSLEGFLGTWPNSGTMRNGRCYQLARWVPHIHAKECSLWPTPVKSLALGGGSAKAAERALKGYARPSGARITLKLTDLIKYLDGGQLNPAWVEWLMGFPPGWTELDS